MRVDWNQAVQNLLFIVGIVVVGALILTAGWFIGSAVAHSNRVQKEYEMTCIEQGGNVIYVANVGDVCSKGH
jgi:hypothetical protein